MSTEEDPLVDLMHTCQHFMDDLLGDISDHVHHDYHDYDSNDDDDDDDYEDDEDEINEEVSPDQLAKALGSDASSREQIKNDLMKQSELSKTQTDEKEKEKQKKLNRQSAMSRLRSTPFDSKNDQFKRNLAIYVTGEK